MTKLLEDFVCTLGDPIEKAHGLLPKMCWYIIKGRGDGAAAIGLAPMMAQRGYDYVSVTDSLRVIGRLCEANNNTSRAIFSAMKSEGLVVEDVIREKGRWRPIVRLPYQRFPERDIFWTDFLRTRTVSSAVHRVLDWVISPMHAVIDERTAENLITLISLLLTTTVRALRDRATHCLVILGDRFPRTLFLAALHGFDFNDPYVVERMLSASYGVLMRGWTVASEETIAAAVEMAEELRRRLAGTSTSPPIEHLLMRDYAEGFVNLTIRMAPERLVAPIRDRVRISRKSVIPAASKIGKTSVRAAQSAMRMDFRNYTIGRLVKGRRNYDNNHVEYKKILKQIEWRVLHLGYDEGRFSSIDRMIDNANFSLNRQDGPGKIDRYGKKYSWIAYFEAAGRLQIRGNLPERRGERLSDVDIDPSFPEASREWSLSFPNLFDGGSPKGYEWLSAGPIPNYRDLLVRDTVDHVRGPWVLLDGFVTEASAEDERQIFTFLRGVVVAASSTQRLADAVSAVEYPGNRAVPEAPSDYYLFAGEIGWSERFGLELRRKGRAVAQVEEAFYSTKAVTVTKLYRDLTKAERRQHKNMRFSISDDGAIVLTDGRVPSPNESISITRYVRVPGIRVEVPVRGFGWEGYHSQENDGGNPNYPSPSLVERLGLRKRGAAIDLVDENGEPATMYRVVYPVEGREDRHFKTRLLYIRADLLNRYLSRRRAVLAWINWGEREFDYRTAEVVRECPAAQQIWQSHLHIHKRMYVYHRNRGSADGLAYEIDLTPRNTP